MDDLEIKNFLREVTQQDMKMPEVTSYYTSLEGDIAGLVVVMSGNRPIAFMSQQEFSRQVED